MSTIVGKGFRCDCCGETKHPDPDSCGTGYRTNEKGQKICYACCGKEDKEYMIENGRTVLYYTPAVSCTIRLFHEPAKISNWPGTLTFHPIYTKQGRHNIARSRVDVWFNGPDGFVWWGVQYGDFTQILHCKRTKKKT